MIVVVARTRKNKEAKQQNQRCNKVRRENFTFNTNVKRIEKIEPGCIERKKVQQTYTRTHARTHQYGYRFPHVENIYSFTVSNNNRQNCFVAKKKSSSSFRRHTKIIGNVSRRGKNFDMLHLEYNVPFLNTGFEQRR